MLKSAAKFEPVLHSPSKTGPASRAAGIALLVCAAGASMLPVWAALWYIWSTDPLRSIGMVFPLLSLAGVLRAWRDLRWRLDCCWWGLPLVVLAVAGAGIFSQPVLIGYLFGYELRPLHVSMALFCYGTGCALLFGGVPLLRRAIAPLALLLAVDPVPHFFNQHFDLPLQYFSATTARAFAHAIGLQPTGAELQMMFAPRFGVFIAPGCNGIRGAVTLGYLALIFGYVRRLPMRTLAVFATSAMLLGYLFNLVRLCVLVLYYRAGMAHPVIQPYGAQADYGIGCALFLVATLGVGAGITMYQMRHPEHLRLVQPPWLLPSARASITSAAVVVAALAMAFFVPRARSAYATYTPRLTAAGALKALPSRAGPYTLVATSLEMGADGATHFVFGDYVREGSGEHLHFGIYVLSEDHRIARSLRTQGIVPESTEAMDAMAAGAVPMHLMLSFYHDGTSRSVDAESFCRPTFCDERVLGNPYRTALLTPHFADLFTTPTGRRVPIVLREEWNGSPESSDVLRARFGASAREFFQSLSMEPLFAGAR